MIIIKRTKKGTPNIEYIINNNASLLVFLNNIINPKIKWKNIGNELMPMIDKIYESDERISLKYWNNKIWGPNIKKYQNRLSKIFWIIRGYTEDEANEEISKIQTDFGLKFSNNIKESPEKYTGFTSSQLDWWIKKGYTKEEAIIKRALRQSTFSKNILHEKYGKEIGDIILKNRNEKWIDSLEKTKNISWCDSDKDCRSIKFYNKNDKSFRSLCYDYIYFKFISEDTRKIYTIFYKLDYITKDTILNIISCFDYTDCYTASFLSPVCEFLEMSHHDIMEYWTNFNKFKSIKSKWGDVCYYNNKYFQSKGELIIGTYLMRYKIDFDMHKAYPNIKELFFYDFYIPSLDLYIEYCGMKTKEHIERYEYKKTKLSGFNLIWEKSTEKIITKISELIDNSIK